MGMSFLVLESRLRQPFPSLITPAPSDHTCHAIGWSLMHEVPVLLHRCSLQLPSDQTGCDPTLAPLGA